ncbi:MAG TPA: hypothetical protein VE991_05930 [Acidimicrobiales bacterium]|nr:hypothetical protein [Acidimicrobiales bacterium]
MFAVAALVFLVAGVPVLLWWWSGPPQIAGVWHAIGHPTLGRRLFDRGMSDVTLDGVLLVTSWLGWVYFLATVVFDVVGRVSGRRIPGLPLARGVRWLVAAGLGSSLTLMSGPRTPPLPRLHSSPVHVHTENARPRASTSEGAGTVAPSKPQSQPGSKPQVGPSEREYVVQAGDSLWTIAAKELGSPQRWKAVRVRNLGLPQHDGMALSTENWVLPGWKLILPAPSGATLTSDTSFVAATNGGTAGHVGSGPGSSPSAPSPRNSGHGNPLGSITYGVLGAAIVLTVDRLRRRQLRHRPEGRRIVLPSGALADLERGVRATADTAALEAIDRALCLYDRCVEPTAQAAGPAVLRCAGQHVDLVFGEAPVRRRETVTGVAQLPGPPFLVSSDGRTWRVARTELSDRAADARPSSRRSRPLVSLGVTSDGVALLDLRFVGSLAIGGSRSRQVGEAMMLELSMLPWAEGTELFVVGWDHQLTAVPRVRVVGSVDEALSARARGGTAETLRVVVVDSSIVGPDEVAPLIAETGRRIGDLVAVVIGEGDGSGAAWVVTAEDEHLDIRLNSAPGHRDAGGDTRIERMQRLPGRDHLLPDVASLLASARALTFEDAPAAERAGAELFDADIVAAPDEPEVLVRILGPVEVTGQERDFQRAWALELVVFLSLRARGATTEEWATALWPDRAPAAASLYSTASAARRALGSARSGADHLPRGHGRLALGPGVSTDWRLFQSLAESPDTADWKRALALVRGRPLDGLRQPDWAILDGTMAAIESLVVDVGIRLAAVALRDGDTATAEFSARQALKASPYDERLFRVLLRTADANGNSAGVEATMRELLKVLADDDVEDTVHPETLELYKTLSRRAQNRRGA